MEKKTFIVTVSSTYSDDTSSFRVHGTMDDVVALFKRLVDDEVEEATFDDENEYYNRYNFHINKEESYISKKIYFINNYFTLFQAELDSEPRILS